MLAGQADTQVPAYRAYYNAQLMHWEEERQDKQPDEHEAQV